ncbi:hypothetical protein AXG93_4876s1130 [Marchantia polymorpha subsp. ruderalis]|uniref:Uncharacterized protein n=1 Tax=Marchantia polymorpha subsp. ruderalis TaxID=1480154 RepID=A0A176WEJ1_MARPO|nr:hypothetical protein AXG93_4876s1130 [Marchantia polymorpha subsp. ruderalis]
MTRERAAILSAESAAAKAALKEREDQLWEKEIECEVQQLNLAKKFKRCVELEKTFDGLCISNKNAQKMTVDLLTTLEKSREAYDAAVKRSERLITTTERREKIHVEELAKVKARRAKEVRIAEELRWKIAEAETAEEDLCSKIAEIASKCYKEFRRAEELPTSLSERIQKHEEELTNWAKKLADCELAESSEVECNLKVCDVRIANGEMAKVRFARATVDEH